MLLPSAALETLRFAFIAAGIGGDFRIGANRHLFIREGFALSNHALGRLVFAMPVFQKRERVYIIEGLAAAAVVHTGYHKQAAEALGVWRVGVHLAEPCHLVFGGKHGVGHAGEHNQFAAACAEGAQIGGHRIVNRAGFGTAGVMKYQVSEPAPSVTPRESGLAVCELPSFHARQSGWFRPVS